MAVDGKKIALGAAAVSAAAALCALLLMRYSPASTKTVEIGGTSVSVEVADTDAARARGLSGRASLPAGSGMLFVFDTPGTYGFWMKGMNFPLDIIWADASGTVTTVDPSLAPSTYPNVFYPQAPSKYVLEVPAGFAAAHDIAPGGKIVVQ